jgi:sulfonate transport system substrate-binding protein
MSPSACSESAKSKSLKESRGSELSLRVGIVPEHFSAPLFLMAMDEQRYFASDVPRTISLPEHCNNEIGRGASGNSDSDGPRQFEPISMPCGTGEMIAALENEDIDISVSLTEGIVAKAINQRLQALDLVADEKKSSTGSNEHVQDSFLTIMGLYVSSPLTWSIAIAPQSNMTRISELDGGKIGISRYGSGSHIMAIILGVSLGISFEFVVCGSITGLLQAVQEEKIDAFLWELITTKPYYEEGRLKMLDTLTSPWPAFVFARYCFCLYIVYLFFMYISISNMKI